jgi:hypothetical protein
LVQYVTPLSNTGPVKPKNRDVITNTNPEGRYDEVKMVEKHKHPEKRDVVVNINPKGKHDN